MFRKHYYFASILYINGQHIIEKEVCQDYPFLFQPLTLFVSHSNAIWLLFWLATKRLEDYFNPTVTMGDVAAVYGVSHILNEL